MDPLRALFGQKRGPDNRPYGQQGSRGKWIAWLLTLLLLLALQPVWERFDPLYFDWRGTLAQTSPAADLVILDIDEASLSLLGPWPWPRAQLADLASRLRSLGVRQQIWDITLAEPRPGDEHLRAAMTHGDIILGVVPVIDPNVTNPPLQGQILSALPASLCAPETPFPRAFGHIGMAETLLSPQAALGHLAPTLAPDGRVRRLPAVVCDEGKPIPSLAMAAQLRTQPAAALAQITLMRQHLPWQAPWLLHTPRGDYPVDAQGSFLLDFATPLAAYTSIPAHSLYAESSNESTSRLAALLVDKTVLIGSTALGSGDRVATALASLTPGVVVHAQLHTLLSTQTLPHPLNAPYLLAILLFALGTSLIPHSRARLAHTLPISALLTLSWAFWLQGTWRMPILPLLAGYLLLAAAILAVRLGEERLVRRQLQRKLSLLLPPALLEQLDADSPQDIVNARRTECGLLHARLRNLGRFGARQSPETILALLHATQNVAQRCAVQCGAQLYPGHGNELYLVWPQVDAARDAAAMMAASRTLHQEISALLTPLNADPPLACEIALHIDETLEGFIGGRDRRRPILYGSLTQVTEQLLALTTELAAPVLCTEKIAAYLPAGECLDLGAFKLPDILQPHDLYAPRGVLDPYPSLLRAA